MPRRLVVVPLTALALALGAVVPGIVASASAGAVTPADVTPTPDPTASPTPTPDPSGAPTPTPDPTDTPTPTPNPTPTPVAAGFLTSTVRNGQVLRATDVIQVTATRGSIVEVTLSAGTVVVSHFASPSTLPPGATTPAAALVPVWTAPRDLPPATVLFLAVRAVGQNGKAMGLTRTFTSAFVGTAVRPDVTPGSNAVVGVGYPVVVRLNAPITSTAGRAAVEKGLLVTTDRPIGAASWSWLNARELHYRPAAFWPAHTHITVHIALAAVRLGRSLWGAVNRKVAFQTGRAMVLSIDNVKHVMTVTVDGKVVRKVPVSLGKPGDETRSGIKIIMERYTILRMTSATFGVTSGPEFYDLMVPYAMRITNSGEFLHGAPWNGQIGYANLSHGCTNMRVEDAHWLFLNALMGDPVITTGTTRPMEANNGLGGDWDTTFAVWKARSALK